jgi:predicted PurR-regulated permease PerM
MTTMNDSEQKSSPKWNGTAKLVVALIASIVVFYLLYRFRVYLAPLLLSFLLAYLFHPLASFINRRFKIPWRVVSTLIFVLLFLIVLGLVTWGGISIVEQVQNLVKYLQTLIGDLPAFFADLSSKPLIIGTLEFDLVQFDMDSLWTQVQGVVEPILTNLGSLVGTIASGAATTVVGLIFIILIAYFIMIETGGVREAMFKLNIPSYEEDLKKMGNQISKIWNAFLRGQLIIFGFTVIIYTILLSAMGVRYSFLLALLAGAARFVPYVGPFVAWTTYGLVSLFQTNYFGFQPIVFALVVVGVALVTDLLLDNFVSPRVMSDVLKVHPAAVLVMVLISASLFGFIGVLLSAPLLATMQLISTYIFRKLMDQDPWEGLQTFPPPVSMKITFEKFWNRFLSLFKRKKKTDKTS